MQSREKWLLDRVNSIVLEMQRYRKEKYIIPVEWAEELAEHLRALKELKDKDGK